LIEDINKPVFFITGRERSGTTLLRFIFDAHPNVLIPIEYHFVLFLYSKYHKRINWEAKDILEFYNDLLGLPKFNLLNLDYEKLKHDLLSLENKANYSLLCKVVYANYISFFDKKQILAYGDKAPFYSLYCKKLLNVFPDAKFIHIVRDPRDNALSMKNTKFEAHIISSLVYRWKYYNRKVYDLQKKFPKSFYILKYEDFVSDPNYYAKDICSFLNIPFEQAMLEFSDHKERFIETYPKWIFSKAHSRLFKPITNEGIYRWKEKMPSADVKVSNFVAGKFTEKMGYEKKFQKANIATVARSIPGIIYGYLYIRFSYFINALPFRLKIFSINALGKIFRIGWSKLQSKNFKVTSASSSHIPLFFIVGRARSGTTLLRALLDAHPNVIIPVECPFIQHLYSKYGNIRVWNTTILSNFEKDLRKQPAFNMLHLDEEKLSKELAKHEGVSSYQEVCKTVYYCCLSFFPKQEIKLFGDKNPGYSLVLPLLLKVFPDAKFIHLTRDYRDNILSMRRVDFEAPWLTSLAYRWKFYNKRIKKFKTKHPERFLTLKHEDLVSDTENNLKSICSFLDIPFDPAMMNLSEMKEGYYKTYPAEILDKYHKSLFEPIDKGKLYQWKKNMTVKEIRKADLVVGKAAEEFGYERQFKNGNPFLYIKCLPGIFYGRLYFVWGDMVNALPHWMRMSIIHVLAAIYRPYWKRYDKKK
jgi:hypothetical protein